MGKVISDQMNAKFKSHNKPKRKFNFNTNSNSGSSMKQLKDDQMSIELPDSQNNETNN